MSEVEGPLRYLLAMATTVVVRRHDFRKEEKEDDADDYRIDPINGRSESN